MEHIVNGFVPQGGKHCVTNALKQIFSYHGHSYSEEYIFGLASGVSFCYLNLANSPMALGRAKPFVFEQKVAERFNIIIRCRQSKSNQRAADIIKKSIDAQEPVQIYVDMPFLPYLDMADGAHFGGHAIVIYGYDDDKNIFYVSDRENINTVTYADMEKARSSTFRPFPAGNRYLEFDFTDFCRPSTEMLKASISEVCNTMLNPPANLLGINGIKKFSKEIKRWADFDKEKLKNAGYTNYYQISADGGSGGGIFRNMYGLFLCEISDELDHRLFETGKQFISISLSWDDVAEDMKELSLSGNICLLEHMSKKILRLHDEERELFRKLQSLVE